MERRFNMAKNKVKTTGALNRAEKFIMSVVLNNKGYVRRVDLAQAVAEKLGLSLDGFKYADVEWPKLPPEYNAAIDEALKVIETTVPVR
jgi:hypothetical protein